MYNAGKLRLIQYANGENRVSNLFATAIGGTDFACGQVSTTTAWAYVGVTNGSESTSQAPLMIARELLKEIVKRDTQTRLPG